MRLAAISCAILLCLHSSGALAKRSIVAVMEISDRSDRLERAVLKGLTDALRTTLAGSRRFRVVDESTQAAALKQMVKQLKRESYRACYEEKCQIPLGRALASRQRKPSNCVPR